MLNGQEPKTHTLESTVRLDFSEMRFVAVKLNFARNATLCRAAQGYAACFSRRPSTVAVSPVPADASETFNPCM